MMTVNSMLLAITFLFGRMPVILYISFASLAPTIFMIFNNHQDHVKLYDIFVVVILLVFFILVGLNLFWAYAILKMIYKVLKAGNIPEKMDD